MIMAEREAARSGGNEWPATLDEIRRFLETWSYAVSSLGHVYVEPRRDQVEIGSLRFFLNRLRMMREPGFPRSVTFDFTRTAFVDGDWDDAMEELGRYARDAEAALMPCSDDRGGKRLIFLHRRAAVEPELLVSKT